MPAFLEGRPVALLHAEPLNSCLYSSLSQEWASVFLNPTSTPDRAKFPPEVCATLTDPPFNLCHMDFAEIDSNASHVQSLQADCPLQASVYPSNLQADRSFHLSESSAEHCPSWSRVIEPYADDQPPKPISRSTAVHELCRTGEHQDLLPPRPDIHSLNNVWSTLACPWHQQCHHLIHPQRPSLAGKHVCSHTLKSASRLWTPLFLRFHIGSHYQQWAHVHQLWWWSPVTDIMVGRANFSSPREGCQTLVRPPQSLTFPPSLCFEADYTVSTAEVATSSLPTKHNPQCCGWRWLPWQALLQGNHPLSTFEPLAMLRLTMALSSPLATSWFQVMLKYISYCCNSPPLQSSLLALEVSSGACWAVSAAHADTWSFWYMIKFNWCAHGNVVFLSSCLLMILASSSFANCPTQLSSCVSKSWWALLMRPRVRVCFYRRAFIAMRDSRSGVIAQILVRN